MVLDFPSRTRPSTVRRTHFVYPCGRLYTFVQQRIRVFAKISSSDPSPYSDGHRFRAAIAIRSHQPRSPLSQNTFPKIFSCLSSTPVPRFVQSEFMLEISQHLPVAVATSTPPWRCSATLACQRSPPHSFNLTLLHRYPLR